MSRITFVHGFNDGDAGADNIDKLAPYAIEKGYLPDTHSMDYGWRGLLGVRFLNNKTAKKLVESYQEGDILVGYSNGCDIIARAIEIGLPVKQVIFIHPALDASWEPPRNTTVETIMVYYSQHDKTTWLSSMLWFHRWGKMGTIGPMSRSSVFKYHNDNCNHFNWATKQPELYLSTLPDAFNEED